ncbi:subtilisin family serine protease [Actinokineospora baliensis]|uniref:S8 family serine peptidase n=1 Tax=Actinokineospora baliensis TaxID=547056 RepID=UPI00195AA791|nr:S8 family serine peptidase [Actinokineospora baliensis]MBM7771924.1 subtilisin family serine protease [Actinokineospora baliensis]
MIQPPRRRRGRIALGMAFTTAVAGAVLTTFPTANAAPVQTPSEEGPGIGKHDQELLAKAQQAGEKTVKVLIATKEGDAARHVDELTKAGAKVEYREDEIGYVRAEVPVDKVTKLAKLPGVTALDLDENVPLPDPRPTGVADPTPQPAPGPNTPRVNPYMPTGDTNAAQFVNEHPTWDGRGTTVAIVDSGVDLDHPSLNKTSTGERKITDWVTYTDPTFTDGVNNDDDPTWIQMSTPTTGPENGLPNESGALRYGVFNERDARLGGEVGSDVNRDGNPAGSSGLFGVLWNPATGTVWVDTNQNKNFGDDQPMTDYKVKYDIGTFGKDNPATAVKESMPYVVQTDVTNNVVNIGIVSGAHGSHVAGIVAGNRLFGGTVNGAAPGAKLVSVRVCLFITGCTNHALLEGMIYSARDAGADVINMSIGGLPALNDANNARAELYDRLIDTYDVQMFISAGNSGAGANTVGDPSVASKVLSVGSYITKETWKSNYGSDLGRSESLHGFSSRGPREDGGFKPEIVAPGSAISTVPTWQLGQPVPGTYTLPPGYAQFNGTSMASPQAAGAAALLVSAAKAKNISHSAAQIRTAFRSTARFIDGLGAYEQGNGLIDTKKAWNLLKDNPKQTAISASVPVNTVLSPLLKTPGVGTGIYDREGVKTGDRYTRTYTFNRTTGSDYPVTYQAKWVGNDGTFSSSPVITLPKNSPVKYVVTVNPRSAGIHSAILNLDSPLTSGIEAQTLNTVIAAEDFTATNSYTVRKGGQLGRNEVAKFYYRVPAGTPAFKVDLQGGGTGAGAGQLRFLRFHPYGVGIEANASTNCYNPPVAGCDAGSPTSRTLTNPQAGVWEVVVEARRTSDAAYAPFTLTASVLGASVSPNPDTIASATKGTPVTRSYTLKNLFGPFTGKAIGTPLGSAKLGTLSITDGQNQQYQVVVPAGSTSLRAKIGKTSDVGADLDLAVFNCTSGSCVLAGQQADGDSEEEVTIANPAAGTWIVLVQGYAVPAGTTTYSYLDVFANPAFGTVSVTDTNATRAAGAQWTVSGTVTANQAPAAGRVLLGNVEVRNDGNVLVGTGDVVVQAVS